MQIKKILLLVCLIVCSVSCKEGDDGLEGKWQLREMRYDDKVVRVDTVFYNFQFGVFQLQAFNSVPMVVNSVIGSYVIAEDTIKMNVEPLFANDLHALKFYYDWDKPSAKFHIDKHSASRLHLLREDEVLFVFRKF